MQIVEYIKWDNSEEKHRIFNLLRQAIDNSDAIRLLVINGVSPAEAQVIVTNFKKLINTKEE